MQFDGAQIFCAVITAISLLIVCYSAYLWLHDGVRLVGATFVFCFIALVFGTFGAATAYGRAQHTRWRHAVINDLRTQGFTVLNVNATTGQVSLLSEKPQCIVTYDVRHFLDGWHVVSGTNDRHVVTPTTVLCDYN